MVSFEASRIAETARKRRGYIGCLAGYIATSRDSLDDALKALPDGRFSSTAIREG
jgi:hypothetical protein